MIVWGAGDRLDGQPGGTSQEWGWLSSIPAPAAVLGVDGNILRCNGEAARLLRWSHDEPVRLAAPGASWFERVLRDTRQDEPHCVLVAHRIAGERRLLELRCHWLPDNELLVVLADCTRQFERRREARLVDRRLRASLEGMDDPVILEQDGCIAFCNRAAGALFGGHDSPSQTGARLERFLPADVVERISRVAPGGTFVPEDVEVESAAGVRTLRLIPLPVRFRERPAVQLLMLDTSAHRITLENLRRSEEQLRHAQKMEVVGRLAAGIAHDFNNVLTAIQGHAQFLLDDLPADATTREDAHEIKRAADRATELTRQLLSFARRRPSLFAMLDVNVVVRGIEKLLQRLIRADTTLKIELQPDLPPVFGDTDQIEQILMNLVVNAREAVVPGGNVCIRTTHVSYDGKQALPDVTIAAGEFVQISVSDDGCGMSADVRRKIFEPFFTTKAEGTGLGLPTVLGMVRHLDGDITVQSEEHAGTTFNILLPIAEPSSARQSAGTGSANGH